MSEDWDQLINMDKTSLLNLMIEKDKRIQDLERLVEDQKRLRLQDSNQVEEKAAKIKEWVTNKLKELENQNKQLRDQNKRQKETVESLNNKLALLSPISSPNRRGLNHDDGNISIVDTIDVEKSLKSRKPQLKKSYTASVTSSCSVPNSPHHKPNNDRVSQLQDNKGSIINNQYYNDYTGKSIISIGGVPNKSLNPSQSNLNATTNDNCNEKQSREESPLYDCVNIDPNDIYHDSSKGHQNRSPLDINNREQTSNELEPPPLPPHQSNKWELQLYDLADQTISSLKQKVLPEHNRQSSSDNIYDKFTGVRMSDDASISRKSSTSSKNELVSLVHPTFTTIDGDQVVEDFDLEQQQQQHDSGNTSLEYIHRNGSVTRKHSSSSDQPNQSSSLYNISQSKLKVNDSVDSFNESVDVDTSLTQNLFDSPMRTRRGHDNILRTQSVRKNPAPEKLYDFITADLVKRGLLVKIGAIKKHQRWFVLKNFHLYSFKRESDETNKTQPLSTFRLEPGCHVHAVSQTGEASYPFKITNQDKTIQLVADKAQYRDEWIRILSVTINMSDIDPDSLTKQNSTHEGLVSVTRHGHSKRCHAVLVNHVIFFLKSSIDPSPISYLSVREAKVREITDNYDYEAESKQKSANIHECSLAIYPKFSSDLDPVYMSFGNQQDMDAWLYHLSLATGVDQSFGTPFEQALSRTMITNSMLNKNKHVSSGILPDGGLGACQWREHPIMMYSDKPITQPLTSLPNETLQMEAVELFKSAQLFTQVPLEPVAIDYHVCLLQNCLGRFLKHPELRNEFYAQLIKQCTYIIHRCSSPKLSSSSSGCSSLNPRSSTNSLSPSSSECQFVTDVQLLDSVPTQQTNDRGLKMESSSSMSQAHSLKSKRDSMADSYTPNPPSQSELIQVMQVLAVAVSLNLPRGRMRWWLVDHLRKFANPSTNIGKYALYTLRAIDRTLANGPRDFVPSRMEIMSILLRNPYDHSKPHSLPVSFSDGSYLVVGSDGSTTVEEFMTTMSKSLNVRHSSASDFYLFSDDPSGFNELHILEPQRKVLDVVGWWEQTFRHNNSGRNQNTKVIKLLCKKRLLLRTEQEETDQERLLIVHQVNHEVHAQRVPLNDDLAIQLASLMTQLTFGDFDDARDRKTVESISEKVLSSFLPANLSSQNREILNTIQQQLIDSWLSLSGKSAQDCIRVYLNCVRRLKLSI